MKPTVLIIGASSVVAQAVIPRLRKDYTIITAGRQGCDVKCDIGEGVSIPREVDAVVNFAASFGGVEGLDAVEAAKVNVLGVARICEAVKRAGAAQLILISSIFAALLEGDPQFSLYALTKRQGDELAAAYCGRIGVPLAVLRLARVYGDTDAFRKGQPFFYDLVDKAQAGEDVTLYGDHEVRRSYIHAADVAEILCRVIEQKISGSFSCLCLPEETYSSIATAAQKVFDKDGTLVHLKDKPAPPDDVVPYSNVLYEKIGYTPQISMETGIKRIKQYRQETR
ncbi:MAG TPA: NAD(P)-dependent oxidoreductase [Candidatus Saccharimonadales bacterium]|nr:NAD(P)-dependent oxidoreductase [Candidatus Saccharimonadales bacterium]